MSSLGGELALQALYPRFGSLALYWSPCLITDCWLGAPFSSHTMVLRSCLQHWYRSDCRPAAAHSSKISSSFKKSAVFAFKKLVFLQTKFWKWTQGKVSFGSLKPINSNLTTGIVTYRILYSHSYLEGETVHWDYQRAANLWGLPNGLVF